MLINARITDSVYALADPTVSGLSLRLAGEKQPYLKYLGQLCLAPPHRLAA